MAHFYALIDTNVPSRNIIHRCGYKRGMEVSIQNRQARITAETRYDASLGKDIYDVYLTDQRGNGNRTLVAQGILEQPKPALATV